MINAEQVAENHFAHKHSFERWGAVLHYTAIDFHLFYYICNDQKLKKIEYHIRSLCSHC